MLLQKTWGAPLVCNDGVTIAKELELTEATMTGRHEPEKPHHGESFAE